MAKKQTKTGANVKAPVSNPYQQILPQSTAVKPKTTVTFANPKTKVVAESTGFINKKAQPRQRAAQDIAKKQFDEDPFYNFDAQTKNYLKDTVVPSVIKRGQPVKEIEKAVVNKHIENGNPKIRDTRHQMTGLFLKKDRPMYNPISNTLNLPIQGEKELSKDMSKGKRRVDGVSTYAAELSHAKQAKETSGIRFLGNYIKDNVVNGGDTYEVPGTIENTAHSTIQPKLYKDIKQATRKMVEEGDKGLLTLQEDKLNAKQFKQGTMGIKMGPGKGDVKASASKKDKAARAAGFDAKAKAQGKMQSATQTTNAMTDVNQGKQNLAMSKRQSSAGSTYKVPSTMPTDGAPTGVADKNSVASYGKGTKGIKLKKK
jgi:hypothetical protein